MLYVSFLMDLLKLDEFAATFDVTFECEEVALDALELLSILKVKSTRFLLPTD